MEPIGFTVSVIGLAGLYNVCLQGLEQIDSGRNLGKDSQKILVLFETEKFLLRKWGEKVGVIIRGGGNAENHHPALDDVQSRSVAYNILANIESIWSDGDTLSKKYGLKMATQLTSGITVKSASLRVQEAAARTQKETSIFRKCTWVIKDGKKFELLVEDLGAFVEKLYAVVVPEDGDGQVVVRKLDEIKSSVEDGARDRAKRMMERLRFQCEVRQYLEDQKRRKLLKWIKAVSTEEEYDEVLHERHKGTCSWIFRNDKFLDWHGPILGAGTPGVLWIHGKPGTGKTFLTASIVEFLKQHSSCPVAYFFCTHEDVTKNNPPSILRSWIFQLATERRDALKVIETSKRGDLVESLLWQMFSEIISHMRCYLVVDGFDECLDYNPTKRARQAGEMGRFLKSLLLSIESTKAKVLIMSRDEPTIRSGLTNVSGVSHMLNEYTILPEDTSQDIQSFARKIVDSIEIKNKTARDNICHQLSTSCEGMFLWVRLEGDQLEPGMTTRELRNALSSMPSGLYHAYKRDIERISSLSKEKKDRAREILRWMLFATRPLSVKELFHILAVKDGDKTLRSDNIPNPIDDDCIQFQILRLCGSLIEVRKNAFPSGSIGDNTIHFVHFSAKEFLLRARDECDESLASFFFPTPEVNHSILAKSCLSYLLLSLETPESVGHAFTNYSAMNWTVHIRLSARHGKSEHLDLQTKFFTSGLAFDRWAKKAGPAYVSSTPLASACWYGLSDISKQLLMDPDTNPNELTEHYGTPLAIASLRGYETVVQQLLSRDDVDVNLGDCIGRTPLYLAARDEHGAVVWQLLARKDLDPNRSERQEQWSPLYRAVTSGYEGIVQQILARDGVNVNLADSSGRTPLYIAARDGHEEIVKHLLAREGLDVNRCEYEEQWSPLYRATLSGHEGIVRKLLANNFIDVNLADSIGRTPLYIAAREERKEIAGELLAREELDVNRSEEEEQWTPLYRAVSSGFGEIVQQLLERDDIDVNLADSTGRTPLYIAARDGHEEIAKQLLARKDLEVNRCEYKEQWSPLYRAALSGHGGIVRKLLANNFIDVNLADSIGRTPLYIATREGREEIVGGLLAREEPDVNRSADEGWTPLYRAVLSGYWGIVQQLLGREDIDINLADSSGRTPLYIAARDGHEGIVQQLLAREELDSNRSEDEAQWTPLHRATLSGQEGIVRQLLARKDVNVNLVNSSGQTALSAAAGYPEIAKLLRERERPSGTW